MPQETTLEEIKALMREVWIMWKETDKRFKGTDERFKETDEKFKETDKKFQETDKQIKELSREIMRLSNLFTTQWGKLIEALVEPGTVKLFKERGIRINKSARRVEVEDEEGRVIMEIDILLENEQEVVVIEVKTKVKVEDVRDLLEKLASFKRYFPRYKEARVYGAIAGIDFEEEADKYAYRQGLFVLKFKEGVVKIANDQKFKPKVW